VKKGRICYFTLASRGHASRFSKPLLSSEDLAQLRRRLSQIIASSEPEPLASIIHLPVALNFDINSGCTSPDCLDLPTHGFEPLRVQDEIFAAYCFSQLDNCWQPRLWGLFHQPLVGEMYRRAAYATALLDALPTVSRDRLSPGRRG
jgi:hypothetical protein